MHRSMGIAPGIRLSMTLDDLRPRIEGRPAGKLAERIVPDFPGRVPTVLSPEWLDRADAPEVATAT